jgi:2-polyprenyl-3-methyl-5-hydroxy-6-metoxy-1,4-benzoquinol methylase
MTENIVDDYGWASDQGPQSCGYIAPRILELLKQLNVRRVLDLGAGNGALCEQIASAGYEVAGVEYDKAGVELARKSHPEIPFYNFGVQDDPAVLLSHEQVFDAVVSTEVIEHLFSPHLLPIYAKGALKQGGYLIITTPYHGYLKNLALAIFDKWDHHHTVLWHGGHIKFWSRATLTQLLNENGFQVVDFSGVGRLPYMWKSMVLVAQKT